MRSITIETIKKDEVVDITDRVEEVLAQSTIKEGVCVVFTAHTTCSLTTADLDPGTDQDLLDALRNMLPELVFRHPHDPSHAPDHILSAIIGPSVSIPFSNKKLLLGTWQRIVLVELSGPRERNIVVSVYGG